MIHNIYNIQNIPFKTFKMAETDVQRIGSFYDGLENYKLLP